MEKDLKFTTAGEYMNNRILDLAKQNYSRVEYDRGEVHECYEFSKQELEAFAHAIVEECVCAIKQDDGFHLSVRDISSEYKQGVQMGLEFAITDIQQHFGVEP